MANKLIHAIWSNEWLMHSIDLGRREGAVVNLNDQFHVAELWNSAVWTERLSQAIKLVSKNYLVVKRWPSKIVNILINDKTCRNII